MRIARYQLAVCAELHAAAVFCDSFDEHSSLQQQICISHMYEL